ncbi:MAG: 2-keto-4-pentenoate hydratase/2-oxohepta-3-ene,7-dioic acid hydratase, partial [Nitrospirae bacterium]|nr:2-keto-4-pentenoate hydratase/2-oxohepta-3-ene,7-dioic acid hydratase [Nitrospirota bacterium]
DVILLAPCVPTKIVAVGLNYRDHARELGMQVPESPILFLKPPTSVIGPGETIVRPAMSSRVDYEAELGIVIRDRVSRIPPEASRDHILGYTCANDVTARDLQKKDGQWTRAKSFDTFCPIGPWIQTDLDPDDLLIESYVNGERRQSSRTSQFIFGVDLLVSFISQVMTLEPGDLIITGTPAGIGPLQAGDEVEVRIEGIGCLKNIVR